jgi:hypothetical protein
MDRRATAGSPYKPTTVFAVPVTAFATLARMV